MSASPAAGERHSSGTFRALRHPNARIYFGGLAVSNIGTWLQLTAMSLLVYDLSGKSTDLGITVALQFLPMLLLGAWCGALSDRLDKRRMAIVTQALLAVQALVLGLVVLAGWATVPIVWGLTLIVGIVGAFENPARRGLVTELVAPVDIANATSLNTAVMTGSRIFGPALAALLVDTVGTAWCFLLNAASFAAVLISLFALRKDQLYPAPRIARGGTPVRDALGFVAPQQHGVRDLRGDGDRVDLRLQLRRGAAAARRRALGRRELVRAGDVGVGRRVVHRLVAHRPQAPDHDALVPRVHGAARWRRRRDGVGPEPLVALVWGVALGIGGGGFISGGNGIIQQESPSDMRGRLLALTAVAFLGSTPIGGPITGIVGDTISAPWALAYGSLITLATAAVAVVVLARRRSALPAPATAAVPEPMAGG